MEEEDPDVFAKKKKEIRDKIEKDEEREKRFADMVADSFYNIIDIREEEKIPKEEIDRLNYKRKRGKKEVQSLSDKAKKKKVTELTNAQKVYDILQKSSSIDENSIRAAASEANVVITPDNVKFFASLGQARANLRKFGVPGTICKHPFHLFTKSRFYAATEVITNDINAIYSFYWLMFTVAAKEGGIQEYTAIGADSKIKDFSFVTDNSFVCKTVKSGYVQDYSPKVGLIAPKALTTTEMDEFAQAILKFKETGAISVVINNPEKTQKMLFLQYKQTLLIGLGANKDEDVLTLIKAAGNIECVNAKNALQKGLKEIKIDAAQGSYLNIHDLKPTDFSPSCLFITPTINNPRIFINAEIETNILYDHLVKECKKKDTDLSQIVLPPNSIFWDNLDSAIELFAFIKLINNPAERISEQLLYITTYYNEFKANYLAWRRIYNSFENIVLTFYDKITTKLQIDPIIALEKRVISFITDYQTLRNYKSYGFLIHILDMLPGVIMMRNFVSTNAAIDLAYGIARLIALLKASETGDKDIAGLFHTIGYSCFNSLFDGRIPMIPKIRSRCAFVGGLMTTLSTDDFQANFKYLVDSYKKGVIAKIDRDEAGKIKSIDDISVIDEIVRKVIVNTIDGGDSNYLKENVGAVIEKVFAAPHLIRALREDVTDLLTKNAEDTVKANATFINDNLFMGYLKTLEEMQKQADEAGEDLDADELASLLQVASEAPDAKKKRRLKFKKTLGKREKKTFKINNVKKSGKITLKKEKAKRLNKRKKKKEGKGFEELFAVVIKNEPEPEPEEEEKKDEIKEEREEEIRDERKDEEEKE